MDISKKEPIYSISTAANLLGISIPTLRVYEKEGLIIPFKKESNQRLYSQADLERVECIRNGINEKKISVNGIKAIYSLIPCWSIVNCNASDRKDCVAYNSHNKVCWMINHKNNFCSGKDCRECEVYQSFGTCDSIKNKMKELLA